jgi:hypothetical protein
MPVKWKIFLALNFVLSLPALVCFILAIIKLLNSHRYRGDDFIFCIFALVLLIIALNGFLNIYLLQRFYPDKLVPSGAKQLNILSLVLNGLAAIVVLIFCIFGASEEFSRHNEERDSTGKIALAIIFFLWLVQVVVLIMQGQLPGLINRNNRKKMDSLIDSIGQ